MNARKIVTCFGLSVLLSSTAIAASDSGITYKNQRGSEMVLNWHKNFQNTGTLSGTLTTAVGNCKADMGVPMPLVGYFNGNAVSITVNFPHCHQVVAMTGNASQDRSTIHTLWLDASQADDPRGKDWNSNITGSDSWKSS